jgi:uncharacterized protein YndB with AHSA1/START domain
MTVVSSVVDGTIVASVEVDAPPDAVFRAISSPEICEWWGSDDLYRVTNWVGDVRPGGAWQCEAKRTNGDDVSIVRGEFITVDPPRVLVHTWCPSWENFASTTVRYDVVPTSRGSRVNVTHTGFTEAAASRGHADGWTRVLGWLREYFPS